MEQLTKMPCMPAANDAFLKVMQFGANIQLNHFLVKVCSKNNPFPEGHGNLMNLKCRYHLLCVPAP